MSGFSAEWLALREPADAASRSSRLVTFVAGGAGAAAMRAVDLGGGTGANIRFLSPRLSRPQQWTLIDSDPALLAKAPAGVTTRRADLNAVVDDANVFRGRDLVTASALLDLVSEQWLDRLVAQCAAAGASVLFALSYDGRIVCNPPDAEDEEIARLVNAHQRTDKGFGPALGPAAAATVLGLLDRAGYLTSQEQSDWTLGGDAADLQRALIAGWAEAATEMAPSRESAIDQWRGRRVTHIDAGRSSIVVGHVDVAGRRRA